MKYRVMHGTYGRLEDGVLHTYRARTENDVVELDADTASRLGAQVEPIPEVAPLPPVATPALPKAKKKDVEPESVA